MNEPPLSPYRCGWAEHSLLERDYHDREWGVPVHDDRRLFEFLLLEGAQAGLSWLTILRKREHYRRAFADFDPVQVAAYDQARLDVLLHDAGLVRNRLKLAAAIGNARVFLDIQARHGSFDRYLWAFVDEKPIRNSWSSLSKIPARTPLADRLSRDLQRQGGKFVGPTICYAFMQAVGLVNDHLTTCFRYRELGS